MADRLRRKSPRKDTGGAALSPPTGAECSDSERQKDAGSSGEHSVMPAGLCRGGTSKADWKNLFKSVHPMPTGNSPCTDLPVCGGAGPPGRLGSPGPLTLLTRTLWEPFPGPSLTLRLAVRAPINPQVCTVQLVRVTGLNPPHTMVWALKKALEAQSKQLKDRPSREPRREE